MSAGDVTKLPVWAQREIKRLEADRDWYKSKVHTIESRATNVWLDDVEDYAPLAADSRVAFTVGSDPRRSERRFDVRIDGIDLIVSGGDGISIFPVSSNVVRVRHDRRR